MVTTPAKSQISVTHGTDGTKIVSGRTQLGATNWQPHREDIHAICVDIDTSAAGFVETPIYVTSIAGRIHHYGTTGASSVYKASPTGFCIQIRWDRDYVEDYSNVVSEQLTPEIANGYNWHINWIAIEPSSQQGSIQAPSRPTPGNFYNIISKVSNKALNVDNSSQEDGAFVIQYPKGTGDNDKWSLEDAGNGCYYIVPKHSGKPIAVFNGSQDNTTPVIQYAKTGTDNSKWSLEDAGDGYFYLIAKHSNKLLDVPYGSKDDLAKIQQYGRNQGDCQKWRFEAVVV